MSLTKARTVKFCGYYRLKFYYVVLMSALFDSPNTLLSVSRSLLKITEPSSIGLRIYRVRSQSCGTTRRTYCSRSMQTRPQVIKERCVVWLRSGTERRSFSVWRLTWNKSVNISRLDTTNFSRKYLLCLDVNIYLHFYIVTQRDGIY